MTQNKLRTLTSALALTATLALAGCYVDTLSMRTETAKRLAGPTQMLHRNITAGPFEITVYERARDEGGPATIYIEGDGKQGISKTNPPLNPTPVNPVALHLATRDKGQNVIYMARPCQYSALADGRPCPDKYWSTDRFSPEVISAMNSTIDNIKRRYGFSSFDLVGYDGGGAVAALVAAERDDITSIRTAAGNMNPEKTSRLNETPAPAGPLNPVDVAAAIAHIPQHHFIAEWDEKITTAIYDSYREAAGPTTCLRSSLVKLADHGTGWVSVWPAALKKPLDCNVEPMVCYETPGQCTISD